MSERRAFPSPEAKVRHSRLLGLEIHQRRAPPIDLQTARRRRVLDIGQVDVRVCLSHLILQVSGADDLRRRRLRANVPVRLARRLAPREVLGSRRRHGGMKGRPAAAVLGARCSPLAVISRSRGRSRWSWRPRPGIADEGHRDRVGGVRPARRIRYYRRHRQARLLRPIPRAARAWVAARSLDQTQAPHQPGRYTAAR
jgi:hypothetical protein